MSDFAPYNREAFKNPSKEKTVSSKDKKDNSHKHKKESSEKTDSFTKVVLLATLLAVLAVAGSFFLISS